MKKTLSFLLSTALFMAACQPQKAEKSGTLSTAPIAVKSTALCAADASTLGAVFTISAKGGQKQFELWRRGKTVLRVYPDKKISEIWFQINNGQIRPIRYFEDYQRGIEYEPSDLRNLGKEQNWEHISNIFSQGLLEQAQTLQKTGENCSEVTELSLTENNIPHRLNWSAALSLPLTDSYMIHDEKVTVKLTKLITDPAKVKAAFDKFDSYQTTDFADVGDNEDDPFLSKMITMGFIEHGASGFYHSDGKPMSDSHGH